MYRSWINLMMLVAESQQVIWLRTMRFAAGGAKAQRCAPGKELFSIFRGIIWGKMGQDNCPQLRLRSEIGAVILARVGLPLFYKRSSK
jgi:hypothetical protein